ncbi:MAG: ATP-binding protein [Thermodesulfobacteriota bacterium]
MHEKPHILVVEDSQVQAELLRRLLEHHGYRVSIAINGREALAVLHRSTPRLILTDIIMPEMDGYELTAHVKDDDTLRHIPILLLTTLSDPEDVVRGLETQADGYLTKPYDPQYLLSKIRSTLDAPADRSAREQLQEFHITLKGKPLKLTVDPRGFLKLLLSSYENTVHTNQSLLRAQAELSVLNEQLELKVKERTEHLDAEIEQRRAIEANLVENNQRLHMLTVELERKTTEVQLMTQQLWQTAKLATIGELAASIAHELNNPLATVSLRAEALLSRTPSDHRDRHSLEIIAQEIERMGNLVANLLQFSRKYQQQISTIDLCDELDKTLELIRGHLRNHGITVAVECASGLPLIRADRQQLRQVFLNLFTNASDAMPSGGTLTIRCGVVEKVELEVLIEISDTGIGIAPEHLAKVLEPFFTTKPEGKGTGLGLPICKRIVKDHGGSMEITSEVGKGTTVSIVLPVASGTNAAYLRAVEGGER